MKRFRIKEPKVTADIHFEGVQNGDYTLCGLTLSADSDQQIGEAEETFKRVSCPKCTTVQQKTRNNHYLLNYK